MSAVTSLPPDITDIRIVRREIHWSGTKREPFSEVFITAGGQSYYSRLWYALDGLAVRPRRPARGF